jgi:hypothetical protein
MMINVENIRQSSALGLIIRQNEPKNLEAPFDQFDSYSSPGRLFRVTR